MPLSDADHAALARLVTEVAWRTDHGHADTIHELFVDEGEMTLGPTKLIGRKEIATWGKRRVGASYWTRHVCTNMRFVAAGEDAAEGTAVVTVYLADEEGPATTLPRTIAEDHHQFVRTRQGWRFASRSVETVFVRE